MGERRRGTKAVKFEGSNTTRVNREVGWRRSRDDGNSGGQSCGGYAAFFGVAGKVKVTIFVRRSSRENRGTAFGELGNTSGGGGLALTGNTIFTTAGGAERNEPSRFEGWTLEVWTRAPFCTSTFAGASSNGRSASSVDGFEEVAPASLLETTATTGRDVFAGAVGGWIG